MFCVAGAILWKRVNASVSFSRGRCRALHRGFALAWQAHHFVARPKCLFHESQCQGRAHETQCQKSWQAQHFVTALKNVGSLAKNHIFQVEPGKPGAEVSKKKTISQRKNSPIECAQGDQPLRCPNGVF